MPTRRETLKGCELKKEYKTFLNRRGQLLTEHLNEYVVIKDEKIVDCCKTYEDALKCGLDRFGNVPFFIRMVCKEEEVHFFQQGIS